MKGLFKRSLAVVMTVVMILCSAPLSGLVGIDLSGLFDFEAEAAAYSGTCGNNLTWSLDTSTGVLNITGTGAMKNWTSSSSVPWYSYRSYIKSVNIGDSVTTIGYYAFYVCRSLTSVTIGNSVTTIGDGAFAECPSLTSVTIPDSVTTIGYDAFAECYSLTSITVDKNNKYYSSDSYGALFNKNKTELIQYPIGNTRTSYTIPDSVTKIGEDAFFNCDSLTSVTIPDSVTTIGDWAFAWCDSLTSVTIPDSVTTIGDYAFRNCDSLTSVTIGNSVTTIGKYAFDYCYSLTSVTIPDSVTTIGDYAFYVCRSLTSVTIGNSVTTIGDYAFYRCDSLTSVTIPDSVTEIGVGAFGECDSLTSVTIPDSVTTIGDLAFAYCNSLEYVYISEGVTEIGKEILEETTAYICSDTADCYAKKYAEENGYEFKVCDGHADSIKVMSYNVYVKNGSVTGVTNGKEYDCSYENRVRYIVQNIHAHMPDSFGLQEVSSELRTCLENFEDLNGGVLKANYAGVGDYRSNSGSNNEASLIYYNKNKYTLKESGTFWLSETGDKYSKHSAAEYPRICTYALLENKETGYKYLHVNTHIEHDHSGSGGSNDAAILSSEKITEFIKYNYPDMPVVITGDFNQTSSSVPYKNFVNAGYTDARSIYDGDTITYTNPFNQGGNTAYTAKTIDHVFVNDYFEVSNYTVYDEDYTNSSKYGDLTLDYPYPSDHHPVVVKLNILKEGTEKEAYSVGEETYCFDNFSDKDSDGHCFGMSITSAGYYTDNLFITAIGGNKTDGLYAVGESDAVKEPICTFQKIQGSYSVNATVAGGTYYKYDYYDIESDWNSVINYVKNHEHDGKGTLQIGFKVDGKGGHAINFLRYSVVNGQERIYAYDNNFPNTETYFYKDSSGKIRQAPVSTFGGSAIDCIALRSVSEYFGSIHSYDETRYIYSDKNEISISGVKAYPIDCGSDAPERVVFEIPAETKQVVIIPLTDDAKFEYLDEEYSFAQADDGMIGLLTLALNDNDDEQSAELTFVNLPESVSIKSPSTMSIAYGDTLVLQLEDIELPEGLSVEWSVDGNAVSKSVSSDGTECRVTSTASGNATITAKLVDAEGEPILDAEGNEIFDEITVKSNASFWNKIVSFFKNLFGVNRMIY